MHLYIPFVLALLPNLGFGFPNLHILRRHPQEATLVLQEGPIPTQALLNGILSANGKVSEGAKVIEEDYGDLGGERPIVKESNGMWTLLGWSERRHLKVKEATVWEEQDLEVEKGGQSNVEAEEVKLDM